MIGKDKEQGKGNVIDKKIKINQGKRVEVSWGNPQQNIDKYSNK